MFFFIVFSTVFQESKYIHPEYNPANFRNDLALVRLSSDVVFKEHIVPVCLPNLKQVFVGQYAKVIGWGRKEHGKHRSYIQIMFICLKVKFSIE